MIPNKLPSNNSLQIILIIFMLGFLGCKNQPTNKSFTQTSSIVNENLPQVVATTSILCDLTRQIAENTINLICLISPEQNPQTYQPKTTDTQAINQAKLIFYNGYNLEPELIKIIKATKNSAPKVAVSQIAVTQPKRFSVNGRSIINPYIWHNPQNAIKMVEVINTNLQKLDSTNATVYSKNTRQIKSEITQLDSWIKSRIATIPKDKRKVVTTYNAIDYYTKAYNIPTASIGTEVQATDKRLKNLVEYIQESNIPTIFADVTDTSKLIEPIATAAEVKLSERQLYTKSLGASDSEANTYQNMMVANTRTIVEGLGGTYLIFQPNTQQ
ncbi:metal ABC transporter substrate-binding protein [Nostoc sp. TCL26-01]|nr:metal ABC transporter substrate-binding protein [Nostoc sp. TCL26-01]